MRHLLSTADLAKDEAIEILDTAAQMAATQSREIKKLPTLRGRTVVNLFFEDSTRTRISFETAAKRLSDQFADPCVVRMQVAGAAQHADLGPRPGFPVRVQPAQFRVGQHQPDHVAVGGRQCPEVGDQPGSECVPGQDVAAVVEDERRPGELVDHGVQAGRGRVGAHGSAAGCTQAGAQGVQVFACHVVEAQGGGDRVEDLRGRVDPALFDPLVVVGADPGDDGEFTEENGYEIYPEGVARQPSSVQRGSAQFLSTRPGDP